MSKLATKRHGRQITTATLTIPTVPSPTLFSDLAGRFSAIVTAVGEAIDGELQAKVTPAQRASRVAEELAAAQRFGPVTTPYGPKPTRTVTVRIAYQMRQKPSRHRSAEERRDILKESEAAQEHERTYTLVSRAPVAEWTIDEFVRVVDAVRLRMPKTKPDGAVDVMSGLHSDRTAIAEDRFKDDGRRLTRIQVRTIGARIQQSYHVWFMTAAGYAAYIALPAMVPPYVLTALAMSADGYADVEIGLSNRAIATVAREQARAAEIAARNAAAR